MLGHIACQQAAQSELWVYGRWMFITLLLSIDAATARSRSVENLLAALLAQALLLFPRQSVYRRYRRVGGSVTTVVLVLP